MCKELLNRLAETAGKVLDFLSPPFGSPDPMDGVITPVEMLPGVQKYVDPGKHGSVEVFQNQQDGLKPEGQEPVDTLKP